MLKRFLTRLAVPAMALVVMAALNSADDPRAVLAAQEAKAAGKDAVTPMISPSRITAVTIYAQTALVTREVEVPAGKGIIELVINPLPPTTVVSSLYSEGSDGLRVLSTRYRARPVVKDTRAEVLKLQEELSQLGLAREKTESDVKAVQENLKMLGKMEGFMGVSMIQATEKNALNAEAAIALSRHIKESRLETARELIQMEQQVKANQAKAETARTRLAELTAAVPRTERDAVLVVERGNAGGGKVRLNYLVEEASWRPQYKLRAKAAEGPVQVEFLANITQNSGEDWNNVRIVLSTAQPMLNAAPPDLQALRVAAVHKSSVPARLSDVAELEDQIKNLRNKAQKDFNERKPATGIGLFNTAAALDQSFELLSPDRAIQRGCALATREGPTVVYRLDTPLAVPARAEEQVLEVARLGLAADFYYKSVPLLTTQVYRLADLVNKSEHVILPGEATMYIGTDFVGQMSLPLVAIGEQFTAGFGVDPQLQVKRQIIDKTQTTQGGNQMLRYEYRTLVSNYKAEKVKLHVWDRLPKADTDAVTVNIVKSTPEISKDPAYLRGPRTQNLLRWDVTVEANATGEKALAIQYEFKTELDRTLTISEFQTAGAFDGLNQAAHLALPVSAADQARIDAAMAKLSADDQRQARKQLFCAIDQDSRLGSMGPIHKLMVKNQPVFLCCKGCEAEAKAHPDDTLRKVQALLSRVSSKRP